MLGFVALADALVDLLDVTSGDWPEDSGTSRYDPEGYQREWSGSVREVTAKPVVGVGRYTSPDLHGRDRPSGALDLIGGARPVDRRPVPAHARSSEGRFDEIRECIGSNLCIPAKRWSTSRMHRERDRRRGVPPRLAPGALHGRTARRPERTSRRSRGGGHGVCVVLGKRGFRRSTSSMRPPSSVAAALVRTLPTLGDWGRVIDYRAIQLDKLENVEVIPGADSRQQTCATTGPSS